MVYSIFVNKLLGKTINHDILNSNTVEKEKEFHIEKTNQEIYTLKYKLANTEETLPISIEKLSSIESQDVEKFIVTFKEMAELFQWTDETSLIMLYRFISRTVKDALAHYTTLNTKLKYLKELKYPSSDAIIHSKELNFIIQDNYTFIYEYYAQIAKVVHKWSLCRGISKEEEIRRLEETYIVNLHPLTEVEWRKLEKTL